MTAVPRISVVIPVHNGIAYLAEAIDSVRAQHHPAIELILVDDGSTDASGGFIDGVPDAIAIHQPNAGPAAARNAGIRAASGELVAFLDQDDTWTPDKLRRQLDHLADHPRLGFVLARHLLFVQPGQQRPSWTRDRHLDGAVAGFVFGTMLARRHVFDTVGLLDAGLTFGVDDVDWFARASEAGIEHDMLDDTLLHRRVHAANLSRLTEGGNRELLRVIRGSVQRRRVRRELRDG